MVTPPDKINRQGIKGKKNALKSPRRRLGILFVKLRQTKIQSFSLTILRQQNKYRIGCLRCQLLLTTENKTSMILESHFRF
ncbi:MAG: hypothetical protein GYA51_08340 [Candidatus Methanofastidiosa archaeon]|nr:hypothetical protein [Candidatus Methanofastidiosa archaeon]